MFHYSILLFDKDSYLFNYCDGTQRNALDHKKKEILYNSLHSDCYLETYCLLMSIWNKYFLN